MNTPTMHGGKSVEDVLAVAHGIREEPFVFSVRFDPPGGVVVIPVTAYAIHPGSAQRFDLGRVYETRRFKCQKLDDDGATLACMTYVELHPVRAIAWFPGMSPRALFRVPFRDGAERAGK